MLAGGTTNRFTSKERQAKGLCIVCGDSGIKENNRCDKCNSRYLSDKKYRQSRKASGRCRSCDQQAVSGSNSCEVCAAECSEKTLQWSKEVKDAAFNAYGGYKCKCCGITYKAMLELDHVHGGGRKHRREIGNGTSTEVYYWLKVNNYPAGMMQVLCATCNKAKHREGICRCKEYHTIIPITTSNSN